MENYIRGLHEVVPKSNYYDSGDWRGTWALDSGGALVNQSVHYVDLVQYLVGPVEEVTTRTGLLAHERIE